MAPFHIKAQILRQSQLEPAAALGVFETRGDEGGATTNETKSRAKGWRQSDVKRALAAAEQAGLDSYRVEIAPDGTISIIVGIPAETAAGPNPSRDLLGA
jgi:hypothetical protein